MNHHHASAVQRVENGVIAAASWGFHVAVDRALGYGLKLASFTETHLGRIGRDASRRQSA